MIVPLPLPVHVASKQSDMPCLLRLFIALQASATLSAKADPPPYIRSQAFENGSLGIYPELHFASTSLRAPQLNLITWGPQCHVEDEYFFLAPRGLLVGPVGPVILDTHGHMIWHREDFGVAYNFDVQQYMGQDVLTFWSGDDMAGGHGSGYYYIVLPRSSFFQCYIHTRS